MSMFRDPEHHAANPPSSWVVVKLADRVWALQTSEGTTLQTEHTKRNAELLRECGPLVDAYDQDSRWYAGETPPHWRSWADVQRENERRAAKLAST